MTRVTSSSMGKLYRRDTEKNGWIMRSNHEPTTITVIKIRTKQCKNVQAFYMVACQCQNIHSRLNQSLTYALLFVIEIWDMSLNIDQKKAANNYHDLHSIMANFVSSWWRHQMKTFSALLALCAGISPATGVFPSQRPVTQSFDVFFGLRLE